MREGLQEWTLIKKNIYYKKSVNILYEVLEYSSLGASNNFEFNISTHIQTLLFFLKHRKNYKPFAHR